MGLAKLDENRQALTRIDRERGRDDQTNSGPTVVAGSV
jgi:hypothetical protein